VSLSWRDRVVVHLAPHALRLERHRGGLRSGIAASATELVAGSTESAPWAPATDTLATVLQSPRWRGADLDVRLSGHFARWMLLPWNAAIATDAERIAYAQVEFESVHGERARSWRLRIADTRPGEASPVCAVDESLMARLEEIARVAGVRVVGTAPAFGVALDRHRHALVANSAAFAFVESGRCTLAIVERGRWRHLGSDRIRDRAADVLAAQLAHAEALGAGTAEPRRLHVVFDEADEALPGRIGAWDVVSAGAAPARSLFARLAGSRP
jgi:hypothetical protein